MISVFGALLGVVVGTGSGAAAVRALKDRGITEYAFPWAQMVQYVLLAAVVGLIAAIRAARLNVPFRHRSRVIPGAFPCRDGLPRISRPNALPAQGIVAAHVILSSFSTDGPGQRTPPWPAPTSAPDLAAVHRADRHPTKPARGG